MAVSRVNQARPTAAITVVVITATPKRRVEATPVTRRTPASKLITATRHAHAHAYLVRRPADAGAADLAGLLTQQGQKPQNMRFYRRRVIPRYTCLFSDSANFRYRPETGAAISRQLKPAFPPSQSPPW